MDIVPESRQVLDYLPNHLSIYDWVTENGGTAEIPFVEPWLHIDTPNGRETAFIGHWVVHNPDGSFTVSKTKPGAADE